MANGIGEFFISLVVDANESTLSVRDLLSTFGQLEVASVAEIGVLWQLGMRLAAITDDALKTAMGFKQFASQTGESAETLQAWQRVAEQTHSSAADVTTAVTTLDRGLANLSTNLGTGILQGLKLLGLSAYDMQGNLKKGFDLLGEIGPRLQAVRDPRVQQAAMGLLGIPPNLREALLLGEQQRLELMRQTHGMTQQQIEDFDKVNKVMAQLHQVAQAIGYDIAHWFSKDVLVFAHELLRVFTAIDSILHRLKAASETPVGKTVLSFTPAAMEARNAGILASGFGDLLSFVGGGKSKIGDMLASVRGTPAGLALATGGASSRVYHANNTFHVHDARDPDTVVKKIESWFKTEMDRVNLMMGNGGL